MARLEGVNSLVFHGRGKAGTKSACLPWGGPLRSEMGGLRVMGRLKSARRAIRYALVRAIFWPASWLPRRWGLAVMGFWGRAAFVLLGRPRRRIDANLRLVFPQWDRERRRRFGRDVLIHLGWNIADFLRMDRLSPRRIQSLVRCADFSTFERAFRRGRGVVVVTGHVGNWELLAAYVASRGYPVSVVARSLREGVWDRWIRGTRERAAVRVLDRDREGLSMVRALRKGEVLGILLDQATQVESVRVPFLGHDARTPVGPARLARKTGAALLPMVIQMNSERGHTVTVGREVELPADATDDSVVEATARCNEVLGELIMTHPEQWVWFHERWR